MRSVISIFLLVNFLFVLYASAQETYIGTNTLDTPPRVVPFTPDNSSSLTGTGETSSTNASYSAASTSGEKPVCTALSKSKSQNNTSNNQSLNTSEP
jgi:hypothetical protein